MTNSKGYLEHVGIVTESQGNHVKISLLGTGCSGCHNSLCMLGSSKAKEVDLVAIENGFLAGDEVLVKINPKSGYKAVTMMYLVPFVLIMITLIFVAHAGYGEAVTGIASLLVLLPYFFMIYLLKKSFAKQCKFEVVKR